MGKWIDKHKLVGSMYAYKKYIKEDNDVMKFDYNKYLIEYVLYSNYDIQFLVLLATCTNLDVSFAPLFVLSKEKRVQIWHNGFYIRMTSKT